MEDNIYAVPLTWEVYGVALVSGAASKEAALAYVKEHKDDNDFELPVCSNYVDGSIRVNGSDEELLTLIDTISNDFKNGKRRDLYEEEVHYVNKTEP